MEKSNYSLSINLSKFEGAFISTVRNTSGQEEKCVCIPIRTQLFESQHGNVFANLAMIESPNTKYNSSHMVKRSPTKAELENKPANGFVSTPILGNARPMNSGNKNASANSFIGEQQQPQQPQAQPQPQQSVEPDDMPF